LRPNLEISLNLYENQNRDLKIALKFNISHDRDYYGNKRLQLAGDLISLLFEEHFKNFNDELKRLLLKKKDKTRTKALDIISEMNALQNRITTGMESAIQTGNWCLKQRL